MTYFPMQCIELFVAQWIAVLTLQNRFFEQSEAHLPSNFTIQDPFLVCFFVGTKLTLFSGLVKTFRDKICD